jgi:hypothetical protein
MLTRLIKFFTSLRLTVVLLAFAIILVWVGTVAQADEGLYNAQTRYFKQWLVLGVNLFGKRVPLILPGGYLLGTMLLVNLIAAHIQRFKFTTRKFGILVAHAGIILLLAGQLATDLLSRETQIRFTEGETRSYAESSQHYELAFITDAGPGLEQVVAIPDHLLARGGELTSTNLPVSIRIKSFWKNSEPSFRAPMMQNGPLLTTNGIATHFDFHPLAETKKMDDKNVPTALVEIIGPNGSLGDWVASGWSADDGMLPALEAGYAQAMGPQMAAKIVSQLAAPQTLIAGGKQYTFSLRPERIYNPFSLTLLKATHSIYPGTATSSNPEGIPKDFRSRVRLENVGKAENREVEIFMNSPLRYAGLTFYQYQMNAGDMAQRTGQAPSSVLQVVRNPGWLTPYIGCAMVAAGLAVQFMFHLVGFISRRRVA